MDHAKTKTRGSDLLAVSQGIYTANRFIAAGFMVMPAFKPRLILAAYMLSYAISMADIAVQVMVFSCESACFACIFTMGMLLSRCSREQTANNESCMSSRSWSSRKARRIFPLHCYIWCHDLYPAIGAMPPALHGHGYSPCQIRIGLCVPFVAYVKNREPMGTHRATKVGI